MILNSDQWNIVNGNLPDPPVERTGLIHLKYRWRDKIIPFTFSSEFSEFKLFEI